MQKYPDVIGLGCCTLDILIRTNRLPTWEQHCMFQELRIDGGGQAATAMTAVSRLGISAGLIATAGNDEIADIKINLTKRYGVDTSHIIRRNCPEMGVVIVLVHAKTGERLFFGGGKQGQYPIHPSELDHSYITTAKYLLIDGLHRESAIQSARWIREAGGKVVFDAGTPSSKIVPPDRLEFIQHVDILISGSGYAQAVTGIDDIYIAGKKIIEKGPHIFVQTEGDRGCYTVTADDAFYNSAFKIKVVDTTGAGDVFHGAYIVGLMQGWDLHRTAQFASAVAAIKCTRMGGRTGIPTFAETLDFLRIHAHWD